MDYNIQKTHRHQKARSGLAKFKVGADGKYEQVKAELKGNTVQLVVPPNMKPTKVAYMRKSCWHGFLKNEAGLPLGPFRAELGCAK